VDQEEKERREKVANDPFGVHEALHTSSVLMDAYNSYVCEHPAVTERADIAELAEKATSAMMQVYQALGAVEAEGA
jgi:hypothetical protein